jgi:hypothetical protein
MRYGEHVSICLRCFPEKHLFIGAFRNLIDEELLMAAAAGD